MHLDLQVLNHSATHPHHLHISIRNYPGFDYFDHLFAMNFLFYLHPVDFDLAEIISLDFTAIHRSIILDLIIISLIIGYDLVSLIVTMQLLNLMALVVEALKNLTFFGKKFKFILNVLLSL